MARTRLVHIVNRTTRPLDCMFDGAPEVIPPGYVEVRSRVPKLDKNGKEILDTKTGETVLLDHVEIVGAGPNGEPLAYQVEYAAAEAYIRQHPIMGTSDPTSVDARDTDYLLGVVAWGQEISHAEQSDVIELIDRSRLGDDRQNIEVRNVAGKRRDTSPGAVTDRKIKENKRRAALDAGENPNGILISA